MILSVDGRELTLQRVGRSYADCLHGHREHGARRGCHAFCTERLIGIPEIWRDVFGRDVMGMTPFFRSRASILHLHVRNKQTEAVLGELTPKEGRGRHFRQVDDAVRLSFVEGELNTHANNLTFDFK